MLSEPFFEEEAAQIEAPIAVTDVVTAKNSAPNQIIRKMLVKIVKTGPVVNRRTPKGTSFMHCTIRDKSGLGYLDLWDTCNYMRDIAYGKVIEIENIVVDKFPPLGPPYYLVSTKNSKITDVTAEKEKEFEGFYLGDFVAKGRIEYIHSIFPYHSCPYCFKSGEKNDKICKKCKRAVTKFDLDFGFDIILDAGDDTFPTFKGFKRILPNLPNIPNDDEEFIEKCLNDAYRGKEIKISYTDKQEKSEIPIIQELFLNKIDECIKDICCLFFLLNSSHISINQRGLS